MRRVAAATAGAFGLGMGAWALGQAWLAPGWAEVLALFVVGVSLGAASMLRLPRKRPSVQPQVRAAPQPERATT